MRSKMKRIILAIAIVLFPVLLNGQLNTSMDNNIVHSGSKHASNITPPTAMDLSGETYDDYISCPNIKKVGGHSDPIDPFIDPIGDPSPFVIMFFVAMYFYYKSREWSA